MVDTRRDLQREQWRTMLEKTNSMVSQIPVIGTEGIPLIERDPMQLESATSMLRREVLEDDFGRGTNIFMQHDTGMDESGGASGSGGAGGRLKSKDFLLNRANRLLGQYNFDTDRLERDLHQIIPRASQQQGREEEVYDHHVQVISTTIHEALMTTISESNHQALIHLEDEWEKEKEELMTMLRKSDSNKLAGSPVSGGGVPGKQIATQPRNIGKTPFSQSASYEQPETSFAVQGKDQARVHGYLSFLQDEMVEPERLASEFKQRDFNDDLPSSQETWKLIEDIIKAGGKDDGNMEETTTAWFTGVVNFLQEQYKRNIVSRNRNSDSSGSTKQAVINYLVDVCNSEPLHGVGGLGSELKRFMRSYGDSNRPFGVGGAGQGGDTMGPTSVFGNAKKAPMSSKNGNLDGGDVSQQRNYNELLHKNLPLWAVVYYCMRCGALKDAVELLSEKDTQRGDQIDGLIYKLLQSLDKSLDKGGELDLTLVSQLEEHLSMRSGSSHSSSEEIQTQIQQFSPWKRAIIFMLLRGQHPSLFDRTVNASVQDYLWMRANIILIQPNSRRMERDEMIRSLQSAITRNGPEHFSQGRDTQLYARALLMVKLPFHAIQFLAERPCADGTVTAIADAVHMGLLLCKEFSSEETKGFVQIVVHYCSKRFIQIKPTVAIEYYNKIQKLCQFDPQVEEEIINGLVRVLLSHMNQIDLAIHLWKSINDSGLQVEVLVRAGQASYQQGGAFEAVRLLCQNSAGVEGALKIMNRELIEVIRPRHMNRDAWIRQTEWFMKQYREAELPDNVPRNLYSTFQQIVKLVQFTVSFDAQDFETALNIASSILPRSEMDVNRCLKDYFKLDESILEVFPYIFQKALEALQHLFYKHQGDQRKIAALRSQFRAYESFFASLPQSFPHIAQMIASFNAF